ncbi:hypothetical protein BHYA_0008g00120 [Botrytis hyacinthi]|uniref:Uncharacterized protein n=1 Tax=Botrytis hyacinthi TaxID=278943 RepID=A0A4Z1H6J7_9HELO|nr:hypothetical protein BHYA_0008g00120 [Botrytis hyacinthi]
MSSYTFSRASSDSSSSSSSSSSSFQSSYSMEPRATSYEESAQMMQAPTGWYDSVTTCIIVIVVPRWLVTSEARIDEGASKSVYSATITTTQQQQQQQQRRYGVGTWMDVKIDAFGWFGV